MPEIDPDSMKTVAQWWPDHVGTPIDQAKRALTTGPASEILTGNFTNIHWALATAYVEAYHFTDRNLSTKTDEAGEMRDRLVNTADAWHGAEFHSTVKWGG